MRSGAASAAANESMQRDRRKKVADALAKVDASAKKRKKSYTLEQQFEQAGLDITRSQFYLGSVIAAVVFGVVGLVSGQKVIDLVELTSHFIEHMLQRSTLIRLFKELR